MQQFAMLPNPLASEVRTFPLPGVPPAIFFCPFTSSLAFGVVVPIPTLLPLLKIVLLFVIQLAPSQ
jgi:hypothetical protein